MNQKQLLLWFAWFFPMYSSACDMCGAFMGITPYDNQSSIQILYRYRAFNGYYGQNHEHALFPGLTGSNQTGNNSLKKVDDSQLPPNRDYEIYQTTELRVKYFVHKRTEINVFVPVNNYQSLEAGNMHMQTTGLGDVTLYTGIHAIRKIEVNGFQHRLIIGGGIKIPTGKNSIIHHNERAPFMMQCGTGSTDVFFMANYILGIKKFGLSLTSSFKINGTNKFDEQALPSTTQYLNLFLRIKKGNWMFIPAIQNYYEYTRGVMVRNNYVESTKTSVLFTGFGMDFFYKNLGLTTSFQMKTAEAITVGKLSSTSRLAFGLTYNFNQTKYLFTKKSNKV